MSKDIFKSLGITIGQPVLAKSSGQIFITDNVDKSQHIVKKGMAGNARDMLEGQISKGMIFAMPMPMKPPSKHAQPSGEYGGENLKNTHGEQFHDDNDKKIEEEVSDIDEVDRVHDGEKDSDFDVEWRRKVGKERKEPSSIKRSMTQEELVLKALGDIESVGKSFDNAPMKPGAKAKKSPKDPVQVKMERDRKKELMGKWAKKSDDSLFITEKEKTDPDLIANVHENYEGVNERRVSKACSDKYKRCVSKVKKQGKTESSAHAICTTTVGKSFDDGLDDLADVISKSNVQEIKPTAPAAPAPVKSSIPFLKSAGIGGMVFDFGLRTGNAMADRATALLMQNADPVQVANAKYQGNSYQNALVEYTQKGDLGFSKDATPFGNVNKGWSDQLNKPMDQQVREAFEAGVLANDPSRPAIKNEFNKTEINIGGQVVKATSETDAALIKMMQEQGMDLSGMESGFIADARNGGAISVTAGE